MNVLTLRRSHYYHVPWANMGDQPGLNRHESTVSTWMHFLYLPPVPAHVSSQSQYFLRSHTSLWPAEENFAEAHD